MDYPFHSTLLSYFHSQCQAHWATVCKTPLMFLLGEIRMTVADWQSPFYPWSLHCFKDVPSPRSTPNSPSTVSANLVLPIFRNASTAFRTQRKLLDNFIQSPHSQSYSFPVVMHECENWTIKKAECWRTDAFELWRFWKNWCFRTLQDSWESLGQQGNQTSQS